MSKRTGAVKVLLNIMSREEWQVEILKKLDFRPRGFEDLAKEFNMNKDTREYLDLMLLVSGLQEKHGEGVPKVKTTFIDETQTYSLYRTEQENELVQKGLLPGIETGHYTFLRNKER